MDDVLSATGVLARTVTQSDGTASEHYTGTDDAGRWYDHLVVAEHGVVVRDGIHEHAEALTFSD